MADTSWFRWNGMNWYQVNQVGAAVVRKDGSWEVYSHEGDYKDSGDENHVIVAQSKAVKSLNDYAFRVTMQEAREKERKRRG